MKKYTCASDSLRPGQLNRLVAKIKDRGTRDLSHLKGDAEYLVCSGCERKSYSAKEGEICRMPQPSGKKCEGKFK